MLRKRTFPPLCFLLLTLRVFLFHRRVWRGRLFRLNVLEENTILIKEPPYNFDGAGRNTIIRGGIIEFARSRSRFLFSRWVLPGCTPFSFNTVLTPCSVSSTESSRLGCGLCPLRTAQATLFGQSRGECPYPTQTGQYMLLRYWHSIRVWVTETLLRRWEQ